MTPSFNALFNETSSVNAVATSVLPLKGDDGSPGPQGPQGPQGDPGSFDLLPASAAVLGGIKVGGNLKIDENGVLSVDTAAAVEQDNTRPVTSAAVHMELGNVEVLLAAL